MNVQNVHGIKVLLNRLTWQIPTIVLGGVFASAAAFYLFQSHPAMHAQGLRMEQDSLQLVANRTNALVGQVERILLTARDWGQSGELSLDDVENFNRVMTPVLGQRAVVSSFHMAHQSGRELLLLKADGKWRNRLTDVATQGRQQRWTDWSPALAKIGEETKEQDYDPRARPWFKGAMDVPPGEVHWTAPYIFQTTQEPGISLSMRWVDGKSGESRIVAFDVLLTDLSRFTRELAHADHGHVTLLTADGKLLGLPRLPRFATDAGLRLGVLKEPGSVGLDALAAALRQWQEAGMPSNRSLAVVSEGETWRAALQPLAVRNQRFVIAALAPAADFSPWNTRLVLVLAILLTGGLVLSYAVVRRLRADVVAPVSRMFDELASSNARLNAEVLSGTAFSELAPRLQSANSLAELAATILGDLAARLELGQGSLYRNSELSGRLELCGGYAQVRNACPPETIGVGEGLIGQCALDRRPLVVDALPDSYLRVGSALGAMPPVQLLILPIISNHVLLGVIELAAIKPIGDEGRRVIDEIMPVLAMCMEIIDRNERTQVLLAATQEQTQVLEQHQDEVRKLLDEQQAIFENAPNGILYTADGRIVRANRRIAEHLGRGVDELVGQPALIMYKSEQSYRDFGALVGPVLGAGRTAHAEWEFVRKDGTSFVAAVSGQGVSIVGHERAAIWTFEDISERKRLEREMRHREALLRQLLDSSAADRDDILMRLRSTVQAAEPRGTEP